MPLPSDVSRRELLASIAALGIGTATFHRAVAATVEMQAKNEPITPEMVKNAEWIAGVTLTDEERKSLAASLTFLYQRTIDALRKTDVGYGVAPALVFTPVPGENAPKDVRGLVTPSKLAEPASRPQTDADLAFLPLSQLAELIRTRKISSMEITKISLDRLKKYDPALLCVVTLTEELALKQAAQADQEIAAGKYRGPLHGIPWVAKDLIAYPGYKTTWGAGHFKDQTIDVKATVAERLEAAGAVMTAKSTLGALAMGDRWFGGMTRNPWNVKTGSSGSSAGTASSVSAGLATFGLGSETLGSIVSPSSVCGATGLRPTFGRVSRHGCMALCWSLDKIGPLARSVEDCALVFGAIQGPDGKDGSVLDRPFQWPGTKPLKEYRVGYLEAQGKRPGAPEADLAVLKQLGVQLVPIALPQNGVQPAVSVILDVESGAAFDDITRAHVTEEIGRWPATFQRARFVSGVDYIRAQRVRTLIMQEMARVFDKVDAYVCNAGADLALTNLTGHPTVCLPNGFRDNGTPTALTFTGKLFGETDLLTLAKAYQDATGHNKKRPPEETWVAEKKDAKKDK
jgi:Asp-tRNA(Asn)/Glu-tRNA(Gln) amidotransferase A subunit family amidase